MRTETLTLRGFLRFTETVSLDLRDVPPGLIAVTGANGEGKTTLLEAPVAAIIREFASRGGELHDYATGRDSFIDHTFSIDGQGTYRTRVNVDGTSKKSDAVLQAIRADGTTQDLNDGKVSTYKDVVARQFPSKALLLASAFSAQNRRGNVIGMKPADGKRLLGELLGLGPIEAMCQTAKGNVAACLDTRGRLQAVRDALQPQAAVLLQTTLDRRARELDDEEQQALVAQAGIHADLVSLEARLALVADQVAAHAAATERGALLERDEARCAAERAAAVRSRSVVTTELAATVTRIVTQRDREVAAIEERLTGNATLMAKADDIRAAVALVEQLDLGLVAARADLDARRAVSADATACLAADERTLAEILDAKAWLADVRRDAGLLNSVPCGGTGPYASCQFLINAQAAAGQVPTLEGIVAKEEDLRARVAARTADANEATRAVNGAARHLQTLEAGRAAHVPLAKYAEPLAAAEVRIAELTAARDQRVADAQARLADADARADARTRELDVQIMSLTVEQTRIAVDLERARSARESTASGALQARALQQQIPAQRARWDTVTATLARIAAQRADVGLRQLELASARARLADVQSRLGSVTADLLEWQLLVKALGKDGVPNLEIDAAGPDIARTTNALLDATFGPRFSLDMVTEQAKDDGSGMKETFAIRVFDNERGGAPRLVSDLSGGEQVIIGEALMNGIALHVNTRSPMAIRTLWRDETTGDLDPENARRYIAMLRKVHELAGLHHLLYVTHNPECAALADAQIRVADGTASLVFPPYAEVA